MIKNLFNQEILINIKKLQKNFLKNVKWEWVENNSLIKEYTPGAIYSFKNGAFKYKGAFEGGATNPQNWERVDDSKVDAAVKTIKKFESGDRSASHNNPGAVIHTPGMEKLAKELGITIEKGNAFTGSDGRTYYTIKFKTEQDGNLLLTQLIKNKMPKYNNFSSYDDVLKFVTDYTGLSSDSTTVKNYTNDIMKNLAGGRYN